MPPLPPLQEVLPILLRDVLAPATVACWILYRCAVWRRGWLGLVGAVGAVIAGLALGNELRGVFPWVPEKQAWHWLPSIAASVMLVALLARIPNLPRLDRWTLCAAASLAAAWMLTPTDVQAETPRAMWLFALLIFVEWLVLDALAKAAPGGTVALGMTVLCLAGAVVVLHAHSLRFTDAATIMAAAFAGVALVAWCFRVDVGAATVGGAVFLAGLMFTGQNDTFSDVPMTSFLLPALAPLTGVVLLPLLLLSDSRRRSFLLQALFLLLIVVPAVVAVVLAMRAESLSFE